MSRRTKLCITALFLVLLAIPVVYIVLAWNPQAPLRFRTLSQGTPIEGGAYGKRTLEVEVRNTTAFPIHLLTATMHRSDFPHLPETLVGELNLDPPEVLPPDEGEFTGVISSHSTWRGRVLLIYPPSSEIPIKGLTVRYVAVSKVKKKIVDWYWNDVYTRLPPSLHPHLPQPSLSWHETKLDDSSP